MTVDLLFKNLIEYNYGPYTGVPCSILKPVINYAIANENYYIASSEGEAMGIAAGFSLAGRKPVVMMQNSGFGNTINPLTSLQQIYKFPMLMLITWRGEPRKPDEPQHKIMGEKLLELLDLLEVPYRISADSPEKLKEDIEFLNNIAETKSCPVAYVIRKGAFDSYPSKISKIDSKISREEAIKIISETVSPGTRIISTTGKPSRELLMLNDSERNFYTVGSMGCAASISLGLALEKPKTNFVCLDGDGAVLMKMGTLATIGKYKPKNLVHICLDNGAYESTGAQATVSGNVDLCKIALASEYTTSMEVSDRERLKNAIWNAQTSPGPHFIRVLVECGSRTNLPRPKTTPKENKERFMKGFTNINNHIY
ncbi:phosphonopyruvate decarboxylase [bacterium]|nr:phosphonopyruvate decarboxylase [bacterium]